LTFLKHSFYTISIYDYEVLKKPNLSEIWVAHQKAAKQVENFLFPSVSQKFFLSTPTGYCEEDQYGAYLDKQVEKI